MLLLEQEKEKENYHNKVNYLEDELKDKK